MSRGSRLAVTVLAACAVLLAGCSEIPVSGPVRNGPTQIADEPAIVFLPAPPATGARPADIVSGFVQAATGNDYTVARQYLTKAFAARWRPTEGVLVHDKAPEVVATGRDTLELDLKTVARVERDGTYTPSSQTLKLPYRLQQVGGQWRIADAPDGVVLAQPVFERTYKPIPLQFFEPTFKRLVPDVRWFPTRATQTSAVIRGLLGGPAGPLGAGITTSAFPGGTRLESATTDTDGSITVSLSVPGAAPTRQGTDRMQQQLIRSLQIPQSTPLRLVVNGVPAPAAPVLSVLGAAQLPIVYAGGRFGSLQSTGKVSEDRVLGKRVAQLKPTAVTLSAGQRLAAVRARNGDVAVVGPTSTRIVDKRSGLVAPTLDQQGWTFSVPADDPTGLRAFSSQEKVAPVRFLATDLGGTQVTKIEVSPDGTRLLILVRRAGDWTASVAGIQRDADGVPTGLTTDRYTMAVPSGEAIDATWADDSDVALLTSGTDGSDTVTNQQLGGLSVAVGRLSNATAIVGTTDRTDLRARDRTGNLLGPSGNLLEASGDVWQNVFPAAVDVDVLAVQR